MNTETEYFLPLKVDEIRTLLKALNNYLPLEQADNNILLKKTELLLHICFAEESCNNLQKEYYDLTGHEPDLL